MAKRGAGSQGKHNRKVLREAKTLRNKDYKVKADLPGFKKPHPIKGRRPDIEAHKGKREKIIEIETPKTVKVDKPQHKAFADYADRSKNRTFDLKITR